MDKSLVNGTKEKSKYLPKENWGRILNNHEAIISQEVFDEVQELKASKTFKGKNTDYKWHQHSPLQGFLYCPECGHLLSCQKTTKKRNGKPDKIHRYFRCRYCKNDGVKVIGSNADKVEPLVLEAIEKLRTRFPLGEQIVGEEAKKEFINLYGKILRYKNILSSFDEFEGNEILSERDEQNYQSRYVDLYFEFKKDGDSEKESINDDVEFEIELFRQIEVNIDYILILVAKYRDKNCQDKKLRVDIDNAINSSIELRSKKDLIERFIDQISPDGDIDEEWKVYLRNSKEKEIEEIIKQENLNPEKTRKFIERSFKTGNLRTTGTEINDLMPPISRFREQGRDEKKNKIIELLLKIFERFFGLV